MKKFFLAMMLALTTACGVGEYSTGSRGGTIQKFSREGLICKSWEGTMLIGGFTVGEGGTMNAEKWHFSLKEGHRNNEASIATLNAAVRSGQRVEIFYTQTFLSPICARFTSYIVDSVAMLVK